jgi:hypothetical protein
MATSVKELVPYQFDDIKDALSQKYIDAGYDCSIITLLLKIT